MLGLTGMMAGGAVLTLRWGQASHERVHARFASVPAHSRSQRVHARPERAHARMMALTRPGRAHVRPERSQTLLGGGGWGERVDPDLSKHVPGLR